MSKKVGPYGGDNGEEFDDGVNDMVRKVRVGEEGGRVSSLEFVYGKGKNCITRCYGKIRQERKEFLLDYVHGEYIKSVEGTYDDDGFLSSLTFITSVERDREEFGKAGCNKFILKAIGFDKIVGFLGRSSDERINALGAHFAVALVPPIKKLKREGGEFGNEWDDGVHDNVREIIVRFIGLSVQMVQFKYVNGTEIVVGDAHGDNSPLEFPKETYVLSEDEYITSVKGHYGKRKISPFCYEITMLHFKTNKDSFQVLGPDPDNDEYVGKSFELTKTDHKIIGFHGTYFFFSPEQLGVYVRPINNA